MYFWVRFIICLSVKQAFCSLVFLGSFCHLSKRQASHLLPGVKFKGFEQNNSTIIYNLHS